MSTVDSTMLAQMVQDFGLQSLSLITESLYKSSISKVIMLIAFVGTAIHLGFSFRDGEPPNKLGFFLLAMVICFPINGKPVGYIFVSSVSSSISNNLQRTTTKVLGTATEKGGKNMPPWYVANAMARASSAKITDPKLKENLNNFITQCIPDPAEKALDNDGNTLNAVSIFSAKQTPNYDGSGSWVDNFPSETAKKLKNKKVYNVNINGANPDCYSYLKNLRQQIRQNFIDQELCGFTKDVAYFDDKNPVKHATPTNEESKQLKNIAINMASSLQFDGDNGGYYDKEVNQLSKQAGSVTQMSFFVNAVVDGISNWMGTYKTWDNGRKLAELNEKKQLAPYFVATVKLILMFICPLICLTLLLQTTKFFITWSVAWFTTDIFVIISNFMGKINNALILSKSYINSSDPSLLNQPNLPAFLKNGISEKAASAILEDTNLWLNASLGAELAIYGTLASILLGGSWFVGNGVNKLGQKASNAVGRYVGQKAMGSIASTVVKAGAGVATGGASVAATTAATAATTAATAVSKAATKSNSQEKNPNA